MKFKNNIFQTFLLATIIMKIYKCLECSEDSCPQDQGECIENICLCAPGYTTFYPKGTIIKDQYCNYSYKYKYYAIWFEMLFPFGIGHFYAVRYMHGLFKFTLFWFLAFVKSIFKKKIRGYPELVKISIILLWIFWIFYCADFFGFTFDYYQDGNKIPLI